MRCLDRFHRKMGLSGGSVRDEYIRNSRMLLESTFEDDPSFTLGVYFWELGLESYEGKDTVPVRIFKQMYSNANAATMKFQTQYDHPIVVGDVLYCSRSNEYLICTESFNIGDIHWQGKFTLCNWILKWQDKQGNILEYPCYDMNATQYNSGEQATKQYTIGSAQHMLTLPYDSNTIMISNPQRFFLDRNPVNPTSYMVTHNDSIVYNYDKGLVRVTVLECPNNHETDRIDLGICDYFEKEDVATDNAKDVFVSKSVISYDTLTIKSGGSPQTFKASFFDAYGNIVEGIEPSWRIICDFGKEFSAEEDGNSLTLSIDNDKYVDEEFKIVLSDNKGNYSSSVIVKVESLF